MRLFKSPLIGSVQTAAERLGALVTSILLVRFSIGFSVEPAFVAAPFFILVLAATGILAYNVFGAVAEPDSKKGVSTPTGMVLIIIPLGFLASSLDCSGLAVTGCSPFCTFVKLVWIPALALCALFYYLRQSQGALLLLTAMTFVPLYPHCVCRNVANAWWIDRFGASPECYAWGFTAALIGITGFRRRKTVWPSLAMAGSIVIGSLTFFVGHHYFKFPW